MSIAPLDQENSEDKIDPGSAKPVEDSAEPKKPVKRKRQSTSHLKAVPETRALREEMKAEAEKYVEHLDFSNPFTKTRWKPGLGSYWNKWDSPKSFWAL